MARQSIHNGCAVFLILMGCSGTADRSATAADNPEQVKLVSIRVAGFVEAAGIT